MHAHVFKAPLGSMLRMAYRPQPATSLTVAAGMQRRPPCAAEQPPTRGTMQLLQNARHVTHRMCRRVAPSALSTLTPSSLTACSAWLPLKTTSMGEMGWPSLYSFQELMFTAGQGALGST